MSECGCPKGKEPYEAAKLPKAWLITLFSCANEEKNIRGEMLASHPRFSFLNEHTAPAVHENMRPKAEMFEGMACKQVLIISKTYRALISIMHDTFPYIIKFCLFKVGKSRAFFPTFFLIKTPTVGKQLSFSYIISHC